MNIVHAENHALALIFREIADCMSFLGENPFAVRSYAQFAKLLDEMDEPIRETAARGRLADLPGVGDAIKKKVETWLETGSFPLMERMREQTPPGARDLIAEGLPPRLVKAAESIGAGSPETLRAAAADGRLDKSDLNTKLKQELLRWTES